MFSGCRNLAGKAVSDSKTFMIDKQAPAVEVTGVTDGAHYAFDSVPSAGCSTTDATSGVAVAASVSVVPNGIGGFTATCVGAVDKAGNQAAAVGVAYDVGFVFSGFLSPVDNPPVVNSVKAGQAVPIKFSLAGDRGLDILAAGYPKSQPIACNGSSVLDSIEETTTAGSSALSYNRATDLYTYVWKSDKSWTRSCRELTLRLTDGSTHVASFAFK